jgi:hypothetical protein
VQHIFSSVQELLLSRPIQPLTSPKNWASNLIAKILPTCLVTFSNLVYMILGNVIQILLQNAFLVRFGEEVIMLIVWFFFMHGHIHEIA